MRQHENRATPTLANPTPTREHNPKPKAIAYHPEQTSEEA